MQAFPSRIGPYVPERLLGRGSVAHVYLARDADGGAVAVKWMDGAAGPQVARFEREIAALRRVRHPGVVRYLAHGTDSERLYVAMELVDGTDLMRYARKLSKRPASERYSRCQTIGRALCEAAEALHAVDLIHRDIKPTNVLIEDSGRVVLTDLGVVKDLADPTATSTGLVVGTIAFAAPEQLQGSAVGPATDQYGIGATLYYLLTLRRPFEAGDHPLGQEPPPPSRIDPEVPPDLEAVVLRMMATEPHQRFSSLRAAADALSSGGASGTPLAGRHRVMVEAARCLDRVAHNERLVVQLEGADGSGRGWLVETMRLAASRRQIPFLDVTEAGAARAAEERLARDQPLLVVSRGTPVAVPSGAAETTIGLFPLTLADLRRTLVASAPLTPAPSQAAAKLHRTTGGIPALLLPLLETHSVGGAFEAPDDAALAELAEPFLADLDIDQIEMLGTLALVGESLDPPTIEEATQVPADMLGPLTQRGLVRWVHGRALLAADLFRKPLIERVPDPDGLAERVQKAVARHARPDDELGDLLERARRRALSGELSEALGALRKAVVLAQARRDAAFECRALLDLGRLLLEIGLYDDARQRLANASAMAKAHSLEEERCLSHVLRAQTALSDSVSRASVVSALDRILEVIANHRVTDTAVRAEIFATHAWAAAALGDRRAWALSRDRARSMELSPNHEARVAIALANGALVLGDTQSARAFATVDVTAPFLRMHVDRLLAQAGGPPVEIPPFFLKGLDDRESSALVRLVRSRGRT